MTEPAAPAPGASVSQILETAARVFRGTLAKCLPLAMLAVLVAELPSLYWTARGRALPQLGHPWPADPTWWTLSLLGAALALYLSSAMMLQQRSLIAGILCGSQAAMRAALQRLPLLLASWVLAQASLLVGLVLLVLPGLFLLVCYMVMLPVVLFEHPSPGMVLIRCVVLVRPQWWKTLAALVIAGIVVAVCVLVFAAILAILAVVIPGAAFQAVAAACLVAFLAAALVFVSALALTLHSAASHSASASSSA
ncbi:MAG TPA: hypothetical protein VKT19_04485 [Steroidobacteraceae bacterium]|nr:hypothetical protein [Steroidobacteraceae bacterium]